MHISRREFIKYSVGAAGSLLLPAPLLAAKSLDCPEITHLSPKRRRYTPKELSKLTVSLHPYIDRRTSRHMKYLMMMEKGLRKHGLNPTYEDVDIPTRSDVAIGWSFRHKRMQRYRQKEGLNTLLLEHGFFQPRKKAISLGWEGINNCGNFITPQDNGERWEKYFSHHLRPWKENPDGYILLMGQNPGDAALYGLHMNKWLDHIAKKLSVHNKEIIFRPHPKVRRKYTHTQNLWELPSGTIFSKHKNLQKDLEGAAFSVTYSSTAAVESVLAGIPCVTFHEGSIARPVTSHDIHNPYFTPDRTKWCHEMAWKQWTYEEIRNGDAWDVVKQYLLA